MKKNIITCFALLMMSVLSVNGEPVILALHHNGNVTFYYDYQFDDAQKSAIEGDTIYFSEGIYHGGINIGKRIHIIGGGQKTIITGGVGITIETDSPLEGFLLENLTIQGSLSVSYRDIDGLRMRKVYAKESGMRWHITGECTATNCLFDRCYFPSAGLGGMNNAVFVNCKISGFHSYANGTSAIQFINCNVKCSEWNNATYKNCIISCENFIGYAENCLINTATSADNSLANCYTYDNNLLDDSLECVLTDNELTSYLGTDGTIVGCYGGETPFTLTPTTPRVLEKTVTLDKVKKTLKVDIKVGTDN